MTQAAFDVRDLAGKVARIEIVDDDRGGWGNIGVGRITFSDRAGVSGRLEDLPDFGTMTLALLGPEAEIQTAAVDSPGAIHKPAAEAAAGLQDHLNGAIGREMQLAPGQSRSITFVLAWHFPNLEIDGLGKVGRWYATKFTNSQAVAQYVADNFARLSADTRLWRDTWYDSTLPYWFLDRTLLNVSTLATSACYRFANGRFYAWEGVGCCAGTCTHVSIPQLYLFANTSTSNRPD